MVGLLAGSPALSLSADSPGAGGVLNALAGRAARVVAFGVAVLCTSGCVEDQGNDQTVQTQYFGENQDEDHPDEELEIEAIRKQRAPLVSAPGTPP